METSQRYRGGKVIELTPNEKRIIDNIIERFDFEKAHALFVTMGWTYYDEKDAPTVKMLESCARSILESLLANPKHTWCESGRFRATNNSESVALMLIFDEVEESINE